MEIFFINLLRCQCDDWVKMGGFAGGQGLFYNQEELGGRAILVRFLFSRMTAASFRIEQSFSDDGGTSWEVNWISDFTKLPDQAGK